ncbi:heterokaryon incompatibility protein-domain-containing protein [Phaeosphaeriaceae sp. PMI808]|nr:heterokaryon incompatibility protein-domain-containing protein [Phaeosphaeriaceae sp. PMI808]
MPQETSMLYTRLDSARMIRLLRLHARSSPSQKSSFDAEKDIPISCNLYPITFHEAKGQGYEALSYTWGDPVALLPIQVNETEVLVTTNLHAALSHFRSETTDIVLWVDALCINQKDDVEKSEQVCMMTEIYANATSTRVWLGLADDTSDDIMARLHQIGELVIDRGAFDYMLRMTTQSTQDPESSRQAEVQMVELVEDMLDESFLQLENSISLLTGSQIFLSRPYWSRVWILQEFVVSRNIEIYCGNLKTGFAVLHAAILYIVYMRALLTKKIANSLKSMLEASADGEFPPVCALKVQFDCVVSLDIPSPATDVSGMRLRYHNPNHEDDDAKPNLIRLLARTCVGRQAGQPKDKIYGLLGMAADREVLGIAPNYEGTHSCTDVYCEATRAMITSGHVDILAFSRRNTTTPSVPSWVPDWREDVKQPFGKLPWDTPYSASGSAEFVKHLDQVVSVSHLKISGFPVDSIESLKDQCNEGKWLSMKHRHEACTYLSSIMSLCQISNKKLEETGIEIYPDPSVRESAYYRVPVADLYFTGFVQRATVEECHIGHEEVMMDYIQRKHHGPNAGVPVTNTLRSYYTMMGDHVERRPFVTVKGFVGLAPRDAKEGDIIVIFPGSKFPYVLRECGDGMYVLVGEAFVHGIMYGEFGIREREMQDFVLT